MSVMAFEKNPNKKVELNKNGTPRKHGNTIMQFFRLEQEYIDTVEADAEESGISKSEFYRNIVHYYYPDTVHDTSAKELVLQKIRQNKRNKIEKICSVAGDKLSETFIELNRIGNNINQIARKVNQGNADQSLAKEIEELARLKSEVTLLYENIADMFSDLREEF